MTPDTLHLIQRWQSGDERAAESLYNQYREPLFRLAYGLLGVATDADEVTQDTLTYALCHIDRYDPHKASFTTWLHTIAVSRCRDKRRRKWLPRLSLAAWLGGGGDTADPIPHQIINHHLLPQRKRPRLAQHLPKNLRRATARIQRHHPTHRSPQNPIRPQSRPSSQNVSQFISVSLPRHIEPAASLPLFYG